VTLLPSVERICGNVTRARIQRLLVFYILLVSLGSFLFLITNKGHFQAFGLGLILPGGGFFANNLQALQNEVWLNFPTVFSFFLFIISLGFWFGTGNLLAPPLVWVGSALWAAKITRDTVDSHSLVVLLSIVGTILVSIGIIILIRFSLARRQRKNDNAYLLSQQEQIGRILSASGQNAHPEMSLEELQRLRFALDRALQPVDEFNGFEWLDQFQTAAVRYQLNFLGYGIALTRARFTPAFGGYTDQAQINLLDKQAQYRVWRYWSLENFWGNLRFDSDPLKRENIMYTGFVALQMALLEASSGCNDFCHKDRFKLLHPRGKIYGYNDENLIECLEKEYSASGYFLIACEPNWIYPLCNMMGASAILAYDSLRKNTKWRQYSPIFRHYLETEFLDNFGHYVPCRSSLTGMALPSIGGAMPLAMPCFFLNAIAPDLALRQWLLLRRQLFDKRLQFRRRAFWRIDTGNYGFSRASAYSATALAAAEMGDEDVYNNCIMALEDECPSVQKDGVIHRLKTSVWAHGVEIMARATTKNSFQNLLLHPRKNTGLRLENVSYPDILIASAHVVKDTLTAVLYPGLKDGVYVVGLAGLKANGRYRTSGAMITGIQANNQGEASVRVQIAGRTVLNVYPAEGVK